MYYHVRLASGWLSIDLRRINVFKNELVHRESPCLLSSVTGIIHDAPDGDEHR